MRADSPFYARSVRRRARRRPSLLILAFGGVAVVLLSVLLGLAFAGSPHELAEGTHIAGVDVGGLTHAEAAALLDRKFARVSGAAVTFVAGDSTFRFAADQLGVQPNWKAAVNAAASQGDGFGPVRGLRRLHTRVFGADVFPPLEVSNDALEFALDEIEGVVERKPSDAALVRHGLKIEVVPAQTGARMDRAATAKRIVRALGSLVRDARARVSLPVQTAPPSVTAAMLAGPARRARIALSAPVVLRGQSRSWRIPRWRLARLLSLPRGGATRLAIGGPAADTYFRALAHRVDRAPVDASFAASGSTIGVIPARDGIELNVPATARRLLRAATSSVNRTAALVVSKAKPERSTADAQAMGITQELSTFKTYNAGTWDRITNLRLGVEALDGTLVAPGGTFSLNDAIGERTAERGFRPAPVIIGTQYSEEIGGGTSQVATTVFNAAWEAGVRITERNPHALYISRYPLGRDATVYWPSLDLKFQNDTKHWLLVKGFAESDGIRVSIYGGEKRRVVSSSGTLDITGPIPVKRVKDPKLPKGKAVVDEEGAPPSATSVTRTIYSDDGALMRTETWNTSYKGEAKVIRVGTKVKKPATKGKTAPGTTPPGDETTTTTTPPQP